MKEETVHVDLRNSSFDDFIKFLFDRDVSSESAGRDYWYWHMEVEFDAKKIGEYYIQLFRQPEFLLERFATVQLDEGFWAVQGPNLDCSVFRVIEDENLPLLIRKEYIISMRDLFERLFAAHPFSSVHMWWDSLCYDWHCGNRERERGGEDLELQDIFFQTLANVLAMDSWVCQSAALHGLGHLHHPQTKELIKRFVDEHPSLNSEEKAYALAAAKSEVQ